MLPLLRAGWIIIPMTLAGIALTASPARALSEEEGLLAVRISSAYASPEPRTIVGLGETLLTRAGLYPGCEVLVYRDLSDTKLPNGTAPLDMSFLTPIERTGVTQDGTAFLYLPPGRYSVVNRSCIPVNVAPYLAPGVNRHNAPRTCCPEIEAVPPYEALRTESGGWVINMQTVDVPAGGSAAISVIGLPEAEPSSKKAATYGLIVLGLVVGTALIVSVGVLRPRFNPSSSAEHPKSLKPDPNDKHADFDEVFGDFLKKR